MGSGLNGFVSALAFLTQVPVSRKIRSASIAAALPWFPAVGGVIAVVLAAVYWAGYQVMPPFFAALAAVTIGILITGALHEDGFADTFDMLGSGAMGEKALEIMRDPRLGSHGTLALILSVVWRVVALASLAPAHGLAGLVMAHTLARSGALVLLVRTPPARLDGLGHWAGSETPRAGLWWGIGLGVVVSSLVGGWWVLPSLAVVIAAVFWWRRTAISRVGGITGDLLGACEQTAEMLVLAVVAIAVSVSK